MNLDRFNSMLSQLFQRPMHLRGNFVVVDDSSSHSKQQQTNQVFSEKWKKYDASEEKESLYEFQQKWYLNLYGFGTEDALRTHLARCDVIFDAGCGLGYKAAWFARLAPHALVVGMDYSGAAEQAACTYESVPNLFFIRGDIAHTGMRDHSVDYVSCDQVIMHTEDPQKTFSELVRITRRPQGQFACYFYAKKALPRELVDDYFRTECARLSSEELWKLAEQVTELGRRLSDLHVRIEAPDIPLLGIKGGSYDLQRFIYWNFLKCFWNEELGAETSIVTNFDWYSPSNARRFSEDEVRALAAANGMSCASFHAEDACFSARFVHATEDMAARTP